MNEISSASGGNPCEPPHKDSRTDGAKQEHPSLRWYHWLAFFSPGMISALFATLDFHWIVPGVILGIVLCVVNGMQFAAKSTRGNFEMNGCLWIVCGLVVNAGIAFGGCALVLR